MSVSTLHKARLRMSGGASERRSSFASRTLARRTVLGNGLRRRWWPLALLTTLVLAESTGALGQTPPGAASEEAPAHLEDGWNVGLPPLPSRALEGQVFRRRMIVRRTDDAADEAWLHGLDLRLELVVDGVPTPMRGEEGGGFSFEWRAGLPGDTKVRLRATWREGGAEQIREGPERLIHVLPDVALVLPPMVDFGPTRSGCGQTEHCQALDFTGSRNLVEGTALGISRVVPRDIGGSGGGFPVLVLSVRQGDQPPRRIERGEELVVVHYSADAPIEVCFAAPLCTAAPSPAEEGIRVAPLGEGLDDEARAAVSVLLSTVVPNPWIQCNLWWILLIGAAVLTAIVINGIVRPHGFSRAATLYVGNREAAVKRDPGRPLSSVPNGRRGFYRSATCCFDGTGVTVRRPAGCAVVLRAGPRSQIELDPKSATVEVRERAKWRPIDPATERILMTGVIYRVNQAFFFRVDA